MVLTKAEDLRPLDRVVLPELGDRTHTLSSVSVNRTANAEYSFTYVSVVIDLDSTRAIRLDLDSQAQYEVVK